MTDQAAEQAEVQSLADSISAVNDHVTAATATLQQFISDAQAAAAQPVPPPLDLTPVVAAVATLQNADAGLQAIVPATPSAPPAPVAAPPATDPSTGVIADPTAVAGTATDASGAPIDTTVTDTGGATDTMTATDTSASPPPS